MIKNFFSINVRTYKDKVVKLFLITIEKTCRIMYYKKERGETNERK